MGRCYLDRRRKCFHSDEEQTICEKNKMICEKMKPIRGEWHRLLKTAEWQNRHP